MPSQPGTQTLIRAQSERDDAEKKAASGDSKKPLKRMSTGELVHKSDPNVKARSWL